MNTTFNDAYANAMSANKQYNELKPRYQFLLDSYLGGEDYRRGGYLTRYQLETDADYALRLKNTPLDNQCASIISLYVSFLFREEPHRELGMLENNEIVEDFLKDADLDGRSLDAFMKEVSIWSSVFGHCWVSVVQPGVAATTLAEQQAMGIRPYLSVFTPLAVTDWQWTRNINGSFELSYIKYIEDANDTFAVIKEWTQTEIKTTKVSHTKRQVDEEIIEPNELGRLPFILVYNQRSHVRGLGVSDINDIADQQRMIYNELSEVYDSIRLDTHPSLVTTPDTNVGTGAGALIHMPENLDPALKPYVLEFSSAPVDKIYTSISNRRNMIDSMANTGSVRAVETREMSGYAMETEFQLLNARLSSKADNLELAEEQIWRLFCDYMGWYWDGEIKYADEFSIRNTSNELDQLVKALEKIQDPVKKVWLENAIMEVLDVESTDHEMLEAAAEAQGLPEPEGEARFYPDGEPVPVQLPEAYSPATGEEQCGNCGYYQQGLCTKFANSPVRPTYWCLKWEPANNG